MPLFQYGAISLDGKKIRGVIDADSLDQAKERLRTREVIVTEMKLSEKEGKIALGSETVIHFTRDLSGLLRSGLPLYESLLTIEEKYRSHKYHFLFLDLCDQIKQGKSLSQALSVYPNSFNSVYISMIASGESTGNLEKAFLQLYKVISRNEKFRKQIRSAMVYPGFLGVFCLIVLVGLFLFLIPSMKELLEGRELHPITKMILNISNSLEKNFILYAIISGAFLSLTIFLFKMKSCKDFCKRWLLHVPLFKTLYTESILMRFSRVFGVLLSSGVPIVEALRLSRSIMNHVSFEDAVKQAEEGIIQGRRLSEELKKSGLFPPLMIRMLATAEETGNPTEMLEHVADIYEEQLERTLVQFTNLLQPVMLLILGIIVGVVLLSVLLPLTDVSTLL
jgi:general secretion pathway protein F